MPSNEILISNIGSALNQGGLCLDFTKGECHEVKNGLCLLDSVESKEDIFKLPGDKGETDESSPEYCPGLAKMLLRGQIGTEDLLCYFYEKCGHYALDEGQHRACILLRTYEIGLSLEKEVIVKVFDSYCPRCLRQNGLGEICVLKISKRRETRRVRDEHYIVGGLE